MKGTRTLAVAALVLVGLTVGAATVAAQEAPPGEPTSFYGEVVDEEGNDAPTGTTIVAVVNGDVEGEIEVQTPGEYGGEGPFDDKLRVDSNAGDEVSFHVNGPSGPEATESPHTLEPEVYELNLTFPDNAFEDDEEDEDDGNGGTGGGGGGAAPQPEEPSAPEVAETPEEIEDLVPETVDLPEDVEPTRAEVNEITPSAEGVGATVTFSEKSSTESIEFSQETSGSVSVVELDREPDSTGPAPGQSVSVSQISVPGDVTDSPATIRKRVSIDRVEEIDAEPDDLAVTRFNDEAGEWQYLETEVVEESDERVIVEATTPGFSYFAVTAVDAPSPVLDVPAEVRVGEEVTFDAGASTDDDSTITEYRWTIDGESVEGDETLAYTFETSGDVTVELTVENEAGKSNTTNTQLTVLQQEEPETPTPVEETTEAPETTTVATTPAEEGGPGAVLIGGVLVVVAALLAALYLVYARE